MLRSSYCSLFDHSDKELTDLGECPYDQASLPACLYRHHPPQLLRAAAAAAQPGFAWVAGKCLFVTQCELFQDPWCERMLGNMHKSGGLHN